MEDTCEDVWKENNIKACRICLLTEANFTTIKDAKLAVFIGKIFKNEGFSQALNESHIVCLGCKTLLRKSCNFVQMAIDAQKLLDGLMKSNQTITSGLIGTVDRSWLEPYPKLSCHNVTELNTVQLKDVRDDEIPEMTVTIKVENDSTDPLYGNVPEHLWYNSDYSDFSAYDNRYKQEQEHDDNPSSMQWFNAENSEINPNAFLQVEILKQEVKDEVFESKMIPPVKKRVTKPCRKPKKVPVKKPKTTTPKEKKPRIRPKGVQITEQNIVEGKRRKKKDPSYSGCDIKIKKEKRNSDDEEFRPTGQEQDSDSSDTSYDESGKPKKKPVEKRIYPRKCDHCRYVITERKGHFRHYLICHTADMYPYYEKPQYVCSVCGIKKTQKAHLIQHELTHGEKTEKCKECGKTFHNLKNLQKHVRIVHGAARLFCDYCNKGFKVRGDLVRHLRIHTGEKPYKCPICGAGFAHSGNVKIHVNNVHAYQNSSEFDPMRRIQKGRRKPRKLAEHEMKYAMSVNSDQHYLEEELSAFLSPLTASSEVHRRSLMEIGVPHGSPHSSIQSRSPYPPLSCYPDQSMSPSCERPSHAMSAPLT